MIHHPNSCFQVDINGGVFSWGHPEHGQLGNHSDGQFLEKAGKVTFHYEYVPTKVVMYVEKDPKSKVRTLLSLADIHEWLRLVSSVSCCFPREFQGTKSPQI